MVVNCTTHSTGSMAACRHKRRGLAAVAVVRAHKRETRQLHGRLCKTHFSALPVRKREVRRGECRARA